MALYLGTDKVDIIGPNDGFMTNGRLIAKKEYEVKLSDTNFSSLTPSTTAQALTLPATAYSSAGTSVTCFKLGADYDGTIIDVYNHDYIVFYENVVDFVYSSSVSGTIHGIRTVYTRDVQHGRYYGSVSSSTGELVAALTATGSTYLTSRAVLLYQKANNQYATSTTAYGIYVAPTPATFGAANNKGYINLNLASASVRGHASYFPVDAISKIDATNTKIKNTWYVYEGDKSMYGQIFGRAHALAANS